MFEFEYWSSFAVCLVTGLRQKQSDDRNNKKNSSSVVLKLCILTHAYKSFTYGYVIRPSMIE